MLEGLIRRNAMSWRFVRNLLIAFLPSAILGFILIKYIEQLLGAAKVVAVVFILGGIAILVDRAAGEEHAGRRRRGNAG